MKGRVRFTDKAVPEESKSWAELEAAYEQKQNGQNSQEEQRDEDAIRSAVEVALVRLNEADAKTNEDHAKVDADDERRKSEIVKDLAKDLERFL